MTVNETEIEGLKVLELNHSIDERGEFNKIFNSEIMADHGINMEVRECYYTRSDKDVIRGMHFQLPPYDHDKIVHVLCGDVIDVVVDLRKNSMTYLKCVDFHLSGSEPKALFIPKGLAHGFKALVDNSTMIYLVSTVYNREKDTGIHYESIGYDWKISNPIVSLRDKGFAGLENFVSPF